jgi:hypothetical protein
MLSVLRPAELSEDLVRRADPAARFFTTDRAEPLLLRVSGLSGPYTLQLETADDDAHADVPAGAAPVPGPALRAEGLLDTVLDVDWHALELEARPYALRFYASPDFALFEADGVTPVPFDPSARRYQPRAAGRALLRLRVSSNSAFSAQQRYVFELDPL